ncbi:o-succinylbenzoate synthase [Microlunatus endophyticus]|uniref:o-succinylbenzoate synthase n=1 Tax=Microlunatus endophyticus TaxID=1716077 RepID=A0A917S842_9ACTN|nr:o-succinylbenzoate synthase [Microlunatus endophyticus]GGL63881.1 o-succinylbenzoate synthase [Microlunatus endophyticus]
MPGLAITTYAIGMRTRFRGITERRGMVWRGPAGWAEWSPFEDYTPAQIVPWLRAAREQATQDFPDPVRDRVPVNCTIPVVGPEVAFRMATDSGCTTAKIKVAEPGQSAGEDLARVAAVRDALGPLGRIRVDANGAWDIEEAYAALTDLSAFDLEYAEQPCAAVEDLARLRRRLWAGGVAVPIAADESIRRVEDPYRVAELEAADIAVLKVQPLGGVRACLEIAERIGLPVVVSSAVETSIGIRAGIALAAALPELPYACGLNTIRLLADDLARAPLVAVDGTLPVGDLEIDAGAVGRCRASDELADGWAARLAETLELAELELDDLLVDDLGTTVQGVAR